MPLSLRKKTICLALSLTLSSIFSLTPTEIKAQKAPAETATAIVAGGCFWCVEADFDKVPGVLSTVSGYIGGKTKNPTYQSVSKTETGHYEAVKITYDPKKISYEKLIHIFWRTVDPTDPTGQFCDKGSSYRTAIFALNKQQKTIADASKKNEQTSGKLKGQIVTPILNAAPFYKAEAYHQNYYQRNKWRYAYYRTSCGRDRRVKALWGKEAYHGLKGK